MIDKLKVAKRVEELKRAKWELNEGLSYEDEGHIFITACREAGMRTLEDVRKAVQEEMDCPDWQVFVAQYSLADAVCKRLAPKPEPDMPEVCPSISYRSYRGTLICVQCGAKMDYAQNHYRKNPRTKPEPDARVEAIRQIIDILRHFDTWNKDPEEKRAATVLAILKRLDELEAK